jgi:uncharacterized protein YbaR (Trm112 family)
VGTPGRTGHDYDNYFDGNDLVWRGKTRSHSKQPTIQRMTGAEAEVHVFWRADERDPFTYAGLASAVEITDEIPVRVRWRLNGDTGNESPALHPPLLSAEDQEWTEGNPKLVAHLVKERARGLAQAKKSQFKREHGKLYCERCGLDPVAHYKTAHAEACIEVHHHTVHVREMMEEHRTNLEAVQCLCANCHRLVHKLLKENITDPNACACEARASP